MELCYSFGGIISFIPAWVITGKNYPERLIQYWEEKYYKL
jgi:hypothetical protein